MLETALEQDGFAYDVFVSYSHRHPDRTWVRGPVLTRLEAEGLRVCIDFRDFQIGAPVITEIERAVEQSRYTLAVLTPRYLASGFTELENVLAQHLGIENTQRRVLCILREACQPRLSLRARLWLDLTDDAEVETGFARLVNEVRRAPRIAP